MSFHQHSDDCPGCRPVILDLKTGKPLADDSPEMIAVSVMWAQTTLDERQAFHRFTCQNSRTTEDLKMMESLSDRMKKALENAGKIDA